MRSRSIAITTAITGASSRNQSGHSRPGFHNHIFAIPTPALAPMRFTRLPTTNALIELGRIQHGCNPSRSLSSLPCAPATRDAAFQSHQLREHLARGITGIFSRCVSTTFHLSDGPGEEITSTRAPPHIPGSAAFIDHCRPSFSQPLGDGRKLDSEAETKRRLLPEQQYPWRSRPFSASADADVEMGCAGSSGT